MNTFRYAGALAITAMALPGTASTVRAFPAVDGVVQSGEHQASQNIMPKVTGDARDPAFIAAQLYLSVDPGTGNAYYSLVEPVSINDSAYSSTGTNASEGGMMAHTVAIGDGITAFVFQFDYSGPSSGNTGGAVTTGTASDLIAYATSLQYRLDATVKNNDSISNEYTTRPPIPNDPTETAPNSPEPSGWVFDIDYSGEILAPTFGTGGGFGSPTLDLGSEERLRGP